MTGGKGEATGGKVEMRAGKGCDGSDENSAMAEQEGATRRGGLVEARRPWMRRRVSGRSRLLKKLEFIAAYCINRGDDVSPVDTTSLPNLYLL